LIIDFKFIFKPFSTYSINYIYRCLKPECSFRDRPFNVDMDRMMVPAR